MRHWRVGREYRDWIEDHCSYRAGLRDLVGNDVTPARISELVRGSTSAEALRIFAEDRGSF
jgi:hypothetical protein